MQSGSHGVLNRTSTSQRWRYTRIKIQQTPLSSLYLRSSPKVDLRSSFFLLEATSLLRAAHQLTFLVSFHSKKLSSYIVIMRFQLPLLVAALAGSVIAAPYGGVDSDLIVSTVFHSPELS